MSYHMVWADDPNAGDRRRALAVLLPQLLAFTGPWPRQQRAVYTALEAFMGYRYVGRHLMEALIVEMLERGMIEAEATVHIKLETQSEPLTADEIGAVLTRVDKPIQLPLGFPDAELTAADQRIARHVAEESSDYVSDDQEVLELSPLAWGYEWVRWLAFLEECGERGGLEFIEPPIRG